MSQEFRHLWRTQFWDRGKAPASARSDDERAFRSRRLLALLASAVRIESGLLRAVRCLMPAKMADIETELDAWMHDELVCRRCGTLAILPEKRSELKAFPPVSEPLRCRAEEQVDLWHLGQTSALRAEEHFSSLNPGRRLASLSSIKALVRYLWNRRMADGPGHLPENIDGYLGRLLGRRDDADWAYPACAAVWALLHLSPDGKGFDAPLPPGMRLRDVAWVLGERHAPRTSYLVQRGQAFLLLDRKGIEQLGKGGGCVLATLPSCHLETQLEQLADGVPTSSVMRQGGVRGVPISVDRAKIQTVGCSLELLSSFVPGWAVGCRRSPVGLLIRADLPVAGLGDIPWPEGDFGWGHDSHGVWLDLPITDEVSMRLRWIPPGTFLMGSPEDENGRWEDETQHQVTITQGFWLAETPCTQAQWQTVMSRNPSEDQSKACPVENVSWEDCRDFCRKLAARLPMLDFRLPTEAEWEYACRAGTNTAFNDGSPCKAPGGKDPALDRLGWYDKNSGNKTHPVGEKQPNAWGLHDMHGNVWEWCQDCAEFEGGAVVTDTYKDDAVDPVCAIGALRVLRGGGFWNVARGCRSAYRVRVAPGDRFRSLGFRLAAGQPPDGGSLASGATGGAEEGADAPGSRDATSGVPPARGASR